MRSHPRQPYLDVTLLDPSIMGQDGEPSPNLGDVIIHRAVMRELAPLFGDRIDRISSQRPLDADLYARANASRVRVVGGTNLLSSSKTRYTWYREEHEWSWLFPKLRRVSLLGVGWGVGYPAWKDWRLKVFYHRILVRRRLHSVRDAFSEKMLRDIGIRNVVNTSCPTLWELDGFDPNPAAPPRDCLFTITDYRRMPERDGLLLETLSASFPARCSFIRRARRTSSISQAFRPFLPFATGFTRSTATLRRSIPSSPGAATGFSMSARGCMGACLRCSTG